MRARRRRPRAGCGCRRSREALATLAAARSPAGARRRPAPKEEQAQPASFASVFDASRSSASHRQLEVLRLRVLELRVREAVQALDEEHHGRHARARRPRPRRGAGRSGAGATCRRPRAIGLVGELDQLGVEEDRLDAPDPSPTRPRRLPRRRSARSPPSPRRASQRASSRPGAAGRGALVQVSTTEVTIPGSRHAASDRADGTLAACAWRSRGSPARASPPRRARRGACPSASSPRARPARGR